MNLVRNIKCLYQATNSILRLNANFHRVKACSIIMRNCSTSETNPNSETTIQKENYESCEDMFISDIDNPYKPQRRMCILCKYSIPVDYKNVRLLNQFVSPYTGQIYDKHITGLCEAQQKRVVDMIHVSRNLGYMATYLKEAKYLKDPKLFDPFSPSRPNPY